MDCCEKISCRSKPPWREQIATMVTLSAEKHNLVLRNTSLVNTELTCVTETSGQSKPNRSAYAYPFRPLPCSLLAVPDKEVYLQADLDPEHQPCDRVSEFRTDRFRSVLDPVAPLSERPPRSSLYPACNYLLFPCLERRRNSSSGAKCRQRESLTLATIGCRAQSSDDCAF